MEKKFDEKKLDIIKLRILEAEAYNLIKKDSNSQMQSTVKGIIMTEVRKK